MEYVFRGQHHDTIPAIEALNHRLPIIRDPGDDFYSRQEKKGLLVGIYEQRCKTFGMDGVDSNFTRSLCPSDLDRCMDNMERIFRRIPCLTDAGVRTVINGPITYTIDGLPLVGQVPGVAGAFCCIGLRAGIGEGGGHGKVLAQIMVHGECEWDAWCLDPRRFTQYANTEHTSLKAIEDYRNEFHYHLPHEYRPDARLARTTSLYPVLDQLKAQWGVVNGWERALFFKPSDEFRDVPGYRFTDTLSVIAEEIRRVQHGVGIMEVTGFNRFEIAGEGAEEFLNHMVCGNIPAVIGHVRLCYLLNANGHILAEATIAKLGEQRYWYGAAAASEWHDLDWLMQFKPGSVRITELASTHTILVVAGPRSRALLQSLSPRTDWSQAAFPWMRSRTVMLGHAQMVAMSVSFSGELAYELHVPNEHLYLAWKTIQDAGSAFDLSLFGLYATESMRMEKGYRHWKADLIYERNPMESGLDRFVNMNKSDFIGKAALQKEITRGPVRQFGTLVVQCDFAPAHPGDSVYKGDQLIGSVTSGAYGHRLQKNIAFAFLKPELVVPGTNLEVEILGQRQPAQVVESCLYDPMNLLVKG